MTSNGRRIDADVGDELIFDVIMTSERRRVHTGLPVAVSGSVKRGFKCDFQFLYLRNAVLKSSFEHVAWPEKLTRTNRTSFTPLFSNECVFLPHQVRAKI